MSRSLSTTTLAAVSTLSGKNFLSIDQLTATELQGLLDVARYYKSLYGDKSNAMNASRPLTGRTLSMIFQKRSTRTRVSTETGMFLLGGHALFLGPNDIQLNVNESMRDTASVLSRFNDVLLARVYGHESIIELSNFATVPVINALSDLHHPLQTLADLMTLQEAWSTSSDNNNNNVLKGKTLAWVGDGNNVLHDLLLGSVLLGMNVNVATPVGYEPNQQIMNKAKTLAETSGAQINTTAIAKDAVIGADVVVTDTWVSMGQEEESAKRIKAFDGYCVDETLMKFANPDAKFLHCLPRHPEEVSDDVFYHSEKSLVFDEAENRMWTVMSTVAALLGKLE